MEHKHILLLYLGDCIISRMLKREFKCTKKQNLHNEKAILGLTGRLFFDYAKYNGTSVKEIMGKRLCKRYY